MSYFTVDILTPSAILVKDLPADSLKIPTELGEINVLREHTHMISHLSTGIMTVTQGADHKYFCLTSGICKILKNKITILSRVAEKAEDVDGERAQRALERAKEVLNGSKPLSDEEYLKYSRKMVRAEARLRANLLG